MNKFNEIELSLIEKIQNGAVIAWYANTLNKQLSEDFIRKYKDKVGWSSISSYQKLSQSFIEEFQHKVDWYSVFKYQRLSRKFIKKFKYKTYHLFIPECILDINRQHAWKTFL